MVQLTKAAARARWLALRLERLRAGVGVLGKALLARLVWVANTLVNLVRSLTAGLLLRGKWAAGVVAVHLCSAAAVAAARGQLALA